MRAFVAGATGYTGREVVRELRARGLEVTAHVRPESARLEEWRSRFASLGADVDTTPWSAAAMTDAIRRVEPDFVFALLGTTRKRARRAAGAGLAPESYESVDYALTAMLMQAVKDAAPSARFVYLSSLGVRDDTRNRYLMARARIERELEASGLAYAIARPSFITGPDRDEARPAERMGAAAADALLDLASLFGARSLRRRFRSTTGSELARALVRLALDRTERRIVAEADELRDPG